jgi:hypothetical protein
MFCRDQIEKILILVGELDLGGHDGVQPGLNDLPSAPEDERSIVNENSTEGFWIVSFKAFDKELNETVIHVGETELSEIKDEGDGFGGGLDQEATCLHEIDGQTLEGLGILIAGIVQVNIQVAGREGMANCQRRVSAVVFFWFTHDKSFFWLSHASPLASNLIPVVFLFSTRTPAAPFAFV